MSYILIVDDDEDFAKAAATVLKDAGHNVNIELNIKTAEKSMSEKRPDLVVLDVMFPENNSAGFELARTMKHYSDNLKDIPILMLTAVNSNFPFGFNSKDIDDHWLPVNEFLEKPVDLDIFSKKVSDMLVN